MDKETLDLMLVFALRMLAALAMGLVIGVERQLGQHPAGVRTNSLVCLGSALFVSLSNLSPIDSCAANAALTLRGIVQRRE